MSKLNPQPGQSWQRRDGCVVELQANADPGYPLRAVMGATYTASGRYREGREHPLDLVRQVTVTPVPVQEPAPLTGECWLNVDLQENGTLYGTQYDSREWADRHAGTRLFCQHVILADPDSPEAQAKARRDSGWIAWTGGECPVAGGVEGLLRVEDGEIIYTTELSSFNFDHGPSGPYSGRRIIAYRTLGAAEGSTNG